jgi:hypothetical protein
MTRLEGLRHSFPTFAHFLTPILRLRGGWRRLWPHSLMLLSIIPAALLWWAAQLWGLPDIGDPFDVEAFRGQTIPDDRNAFVLYRQAAALFVRLKPSDTSTGRAVGVDTLWAKASSEIRGWAEANREALAFYRRGADRPDALDAPTGTLGEYDRFQAVIPFQRLALLEASRLEDLGDMAGAWGWYRAYLRTLHHVSSHSMPYRRMAAQSWHTELHGRLERWSADPRTTNGELRQALEDVLACEEITPSESYTLKAWYLQAELQSDSRILQAGQVPPAWLMRLASRSGAALLGAIVTPEHFKAIASAWNVWRREPERSRRVLRLLIANRLAYYDTPPDRRPAPDPDVTACEIYPLGPAAPANARLFTPKTLSYWLESTADPSVLVSMVDSRGIRIRGVASHHELVMLLATRLYRRDHGSDPPSPEALVGPYLKRLPPEYPEEGWNDVKMEAAEAVR